MPDARYLLYGGGGSWKELEEDGNPPLSPGILLSDLRWGIEGISMRVVSVHLFEKKGHPTPLPEKEQSRGAVLGRGA